MTTVFENNQPLNLIEIFNNNDLDTVIHKLKDLACNTPSNLVTFTAVKSEVGMGHVVYLNDACDELDYKREFFKQNMNKLLEANRQEWDELKSKLVK